MCTQVYTEQCGIGATDIDCVAFPQQLMDEYLPSFHQLNLVEEEFLRFSVFYFLVQSIEVVGFKIRQPDVIKVQISCVLILLGFGNLS